MFAADLMLLTLQERRFGRKFDQNGDGYLDLEELDCFIIEQDTSKEGNLKQMLGSCFAFGGTSSFLQSRVP
eukprot:2615282-Rhodomonas_salina.3